MNYGKLVSEAITQNTVYRLYKGSNGLQWRYRHGRGTRAERKVWTLLGDSMSSLRLNELVAMEGRDMTVSINDVIAIRYTITRPPPPEVVAEMRVKLPVEAIHGR